MAEIKNETMPDVFDCMFTRPYAEDDYLLNDYIDRIIHEVSWKMFEDQEEICHMISESNPPKLKANVIDYMRIIIRNKLSWVTSYIIGRILIGYRMGNIDLGDAGEEWLREQFTNEEYEKFEAAMRKYIYNDYAKYLGKEKANEYFNRIGRPEYIIEE